MTHRTLLFVHPSDELYGADRMLLELVQAAPRSTAVQVWLPTDLPHVPTPLCAELERRGVAVRHVDLPILRRSYRNPRDLARLAHRVLTLTRELRAARPDTVYCTTSAAYLAVASAHRAGVRDIIGHVQEFWTRSDALVLGPLARRCHRMIAISSAVAAALPDGVRQRAVVVENATPEPGHRSSLAGRTGPLEYVVASRWNGWKGHRTLLAAWERAGCPGRLTVLGAAPASGDAVDVPALVAGLSRPESVTIVGEVADPAPHLEAADVVVVPSDEPEPFGLVAIEAFARGRPVVASGAGGLADIVTDGVTGWLFPPGDVDALADRLATLSRDDVTRAGERARQRFELRFTVERYAQQWRAAVTDRDADPVSR